MIKTLVKLPRFPIHYEFVEDNLVAMQKVVGGYIETVTFEDGWCVICDEEGLIKTRPYNCEIEGVKLFGKIMFVGTEGDGFKDFENEKELKQKYPQLWKEGAFYEQE